MILSSFFGQTLRMKTFEFRKNGNNITSDFTHITNLRLYQRAKINFTTQTNIINNEMNSIPLSNIKQTKKIKNQPPNSHTKSNTPKINNNTNTNTNPKQSKPQTKTNSTPHTEFRLYGNTSKKNVSDPTAVEFLFLGTGAANPTPRRSCSGLLLRIADEAILFDCGEGIAYNAQKLRENLSDLKTIILTHNHGDHLFGLPTFLRYFWDKYPNNKLKIIGTAPVAEWIYHSFEICELSKYYPNFSVEELSYPIQNLTPPLPFPVNSLVPDSGQNTWLWYDVFPIPYDHFIRL